MQTRHILSFRKGVTTEVVIDHNNLVFIAEPGKPVNIPNQGNIIRNALENPIGSASLEELLKPEYSLVILVDDITRPTPSDLILPPVLERIESAGIQDSAVTIIIAMGTHRPMTENELEVKLGKHVMKRYTVLNRDYRETEKFVNLGETESGIPVEIDREVLEADFVIAIGNIVPHISAGWGGGSKMILPGICSRKTTDMMHYMACVIQPVLEVIGTNENKIRKEMDIIAGRVGLNFIINTVLDEEHNMLGVFAGDYRVAHNAGVKLAEELMIVPIPQQADILIVSGNPCHFDYWQGIKPYAYSHRAVREGGIIIFLLDGMEGLCGDAPSHDFTVRNYLLHSFEDLKKGVNSGEITDIVGVNVPMYHSMLRNRVRNFLVTNHMSDEDITATGFVKMTSVQQALKKSLEILGRDAKVGIIPFGGETLVKMENGSEPWRCADPLNTSTEARIRKPLSD
jgi:nickel-dependent lactate racemase